MEQACRQGSNGEIFLCVNVYPYNTLNLVLDPLQYRDHAILHWIWHIAKHLQYIYSQQAYSTCSTFQLQSAKGMPKECT